MPTDFARSRVTDKATPETTQQLYLTHCLYDEGITRQAGFAVRASSTREPLLLRFAQEYPPYEPPDGLGDDPSSEIETLQRLALVRIPGGSKALIRSVALPGGRHGRANNFFSHVLVWPALTACEALRLWGSPDWAADCSQDAGKDLDPATAFEPGLLDDRALTEFLQPDDSGEDRSAPGPFCPERLGRNARRRRELLSLTIRGCLLALREPPGSPRSRFFLVAEPPLAALLIYGAMRLLPPHFAQETAFSTYEGMRPSLRTYRYGRIVGTWAGQPGQVLDEEFFTTRGYAFDTSGPRCSEELHEERDPAIDDWLDLAAQGDWNLLDTVYRLLGNTATSVVSFQQGFQAAKLTQRLEKGKAEADDLIALKRSPLGAALLEQYREKVWPLVRDASLPDSVLRDEFGDVLIHHIPELEQRVSEALRVGSLEEWQPSWRLLKIALAENPQRVRDSLQRILPPPPYSSALRFSLLAELRGLQLLPLHQQLPLHSLLRQCTPEDLARFAASDLPREWHVWTLFYSLIKGEARTEAIRQLDAGGESFLLAFWEQFAFLKEETQRRAILAPLFARREGKHVLLFSRSLASLAGARAETVEWLLDTLGAFGPDWGDFWCSGDHLTRLLDVLRGLGDESESLWGRLLGQLDADLFLRGSPLQHSLLAHLAAANSRPGPPVPAEIARAIADHVLLSDHFEKACGVRPADRPAILAACDRLKYDAVAILRRYFERYLVPQEMSPRRTDDFAEFFHSFYLDGNNSATYASRLVGWRAVVAACPEEARREGYLDYYLKQFVPLEFRARLAQDVLGRTKARESLALAEPTPVVAPPVEAVPETPTVAEDDAGFQLTGVRQGASIIGTVLKGSPWLLVPFVGGLTALFALSFLSVPPMEMLLVCSFVPLILGMADAAALQSVAVAIGACAVARPARPSLARCLAAAATVGVGVGTACGALAAGAAVLLAGSIARAACIGGAVAVGILSGTVLGLTLPVLLGTAGRRAPIALGPIIRTVAGGVAVGLYVVALRWLGR